MKKRDTKKKRGERHRRRKREFKTPERENKEKRRRKEKKMERENQGGKETILLLRVQIICTQSDDIIYIWRGACNSVPFIQNWILKTNRMPIKERKARAF